MTDLSMFDLSGKVSVVSGVGRGMGCAMSLALASAGYDMLLGDLDEEGLKHTAGDIESMGCKGDTSTIDVSEIDQIPTSFEQLDRNFARIDFLGNAAGGDVVFGAPEEISIEDFERSTKALITGRFLMC